MTPKMISQAVYDAATLVREHPARWQDANKQLVHAIATPPGAPHRGRIEVARWRAVRLPERVPESRVVFEARADLFDYAPPREAQVVEWHLNFAHSHLFVAYGGGLMAQDELQVAEHPALGSLREALVATGDVQPLTVEGGAPTPITIAGVERRCAIATEPNLAEGRPYGLYGNRFRAASEEAVRKAVRRLDPPTRSNLIAMEAPVGYSGPYTEAQLRFILTTAATGFAGAVAASEGRRVVVHTGFWGCGAYGGDRELMALLQQLSARLAGLDGLVFHTFDEAGMRHHEAALEVSRSIRSGSALDEVLARIVRRGYRWGVGDGT